MLLDGGENMTINTGWATSIKFASKSGDDNHPHVASTEYKEFGKGTGKNKGKMTLTDLQDQPTFIMHGGYIKPYKVAKTTSTSKRNKIPKVAKAVSSKTVTGLFGKPANAKRRQNDSSSSSSSSTSSTSSPSKKAKTK